MPAKVCPNGEIFFKINGKCTVCLSRFQGVVIDQPPSIDIVTVNCLYKGDFNCNSSIKRKLIGNKREVLKRKLKTSSISESLFNDLKTNIFKHKTLPLPIEQFSKIHVNSIIGSINMIGITLGATKSEIEYDNYLTNKNDGVKINKLSDNSGNNVNIYDCFVFAIEKKKMIAK